MARAYIVSFSDSVKYKALFDGDKNAFESSPEFVSVLGKVAQFVKSKFAPDRYKSYIIPEVVEVSAEDPEYAGYNAFGEAAVAEIEQTLSTEIEDMEDQNILDRNAPFDEI